MLDTLLFRHMDSKVLHHVGKFYHAIRMDALETSESMWTVHRTNVSHCWSIGRLCNDIISVTGFMWVQIMWFVLWFRRLVTELSPRRPGFGPGSVHVELVVDKMFRWELFLSRIKIANVLDIRDQFWFWTLIGIGYNDENWIILFTWTGLTELGLTEMTFAQQLLLWRTHTTCNSKVNFV
jgi:hypothetical protein